jgi:Lon protease-like protein
MPLPMFPLGMVALPGSSVPLHIFEPRYRQLMVDLQKGDGRFGIVLIERGSEVGGGEVRSGIGTRMRVAESQEFEDGRWAILAVGEEPIRVHTWLPDDPYPMALVETIEPDAEPTDDDIAVAEQAVRRAHGLAQELGYDVPDLDDVLDDEPTRRLWQLGLVTPCGPADRQRMLAAETVEARANEIAVAALDAAQLFAHQLGRGDSS